MSASGRVGRVYGGVTGEERVAERRRKLIEAGMNLFGSSRSEIVRIKDVVAEAGLTERYFYESFSDLDTLFDQVFDRAAEQIERDVNAAVLGAPEDGFARISVALRAAIDYLVSDRRLIRIFFVEGLGKGGRTGSRRNEVLVRSAENFFRWQSPEAQSFESSPMEARMKALAMSGAISELLISWAEGLLEVTPNELTDYLLGLYWRAALP